MSSDTDRAPTDIPQERVLVAWREGTRTRAAELRSLNRWIECTSTAVSTGSPPPSERTLASTGSQTTDALHDAIEHHLKAAEDATTRRQKWWHRPHNGARLERAISNLDAAEADLLRVAPASYVFGQMPSVLNSLQRHLKPGDPRRSEVERIRATLQQLERDRQSGQSSLKDEADLVRPPTVAQLALIDQERGQIVSAVRGASSAALREQTRLRSFRNVVVVATGAMFAVAVALGLIGWFSPDTIPMCFTPEAAGQTTVVCPTEQSAPVTTTTTPSSSTAGGTAATNAAPDIDETIRATNGRTDILVIEILGMTAAAVAAAAALRGVRGSSEPYGIPNALAVLKLPTGAVTAFLGLLLMRGGFVPGLSALDSPAQILAWAIVFGYAQQLFTRLVDQQAHSVLNDVRSGAKGSE